MEKHFQLTKLINQANNITIYEDYFHDTCNKYMYFIYSFRFINYVYNNIGLLQH